MAEKKWGIIGPGRIAEKFAQDLNLVEDGILHAIASRNHERATAFAGKYQVANVFSSYEEMVHSGELDIVYIATPHTFHHAHTLLCLENQVPVLCEKPAAINSQQLQEMIGMAEKKQIFFMEALWTRFIPAMLKVLEIVADGSMGQVENVEASFCFRADAGPDHRLYNMDLGGGSLLDIGIYPVFLAYLLLGMPERIEATGQLAATGADETCSINLFYSGHKQAALHSSILYHADMTAQITMSKGYILMQPRWHESAALTVI